MYRWYNCASWCIRLSFKDPFFGTGLFIGYENARMDGWSISLGWGTPEPLFQRYTYEEMYGSTFNEPYDEYKGEEV